MRPNDTWGAMMQRCDWSTNDPLLIRYHDEVWGVPEYDERNLFAKLLLDGAQAGLSWVTILRKQEHYFRAFDEFNPEKIAAYDEARIRKLLADPGIVRNRLKIESAVRNARAFLDLKAEGIDFSRFLWQFVDGKPKRNAWKELSQLPAKTAESEKMSRELKSKGFSFVGPTICYAFMQAVGMVNDHLTCCYRYRQLIR